MLSNLILQLFFIAVLSVCRSTGKNKRILLNDPSYVEQQFNRLQAEIQDMQVKLNSQQATITTLEATVHKQQATITGLESTVHEQQAALSKVSSSGDVSTTFVIWGSKSCPTNVSQLVYSGFAGGSWYDSPGSAANHVCLPVDPDWGVHQDTQDDTEAFMFGTEYKNSFVFGQSDLYQEVPCALCLSTQYSTSVMISAKNRCYPGWTEAYNGNLAAGAPAYKSASEYICVKQPAEVVHQGDTRDDDGAVITSVKSRCGSLKCPPYANNKILACIVCLK